MQLNQAMGGCLYDLLDTKPPKKTSVGKNQGQNPNAPHNNVPPQ
ncbi:MAG: hypothetical protein ACHBN1_22945 [Heteroscytonema crispum UTEX LB 1556]